MRSWLVIVLAALGVLATSVGAQTSAYSKQDIRRIVEPGAVRETAGTRIAACQPLRGDAVAVLGVRPQVQRLHANTEIVVLSGRCKGQAGLIGSHRLAALHE